MTATASPSLTVLPATDAPESFMRRIAGGDELPAWFSTGLTVAIVWCATAGITAMVLLNEKHYSAWTCAIVATAAALASLPFRPRPQGRTAHGPAIAAVAIALTLLGTAGAYHSEHLLTDRDPGVYVNTARSIARTHVLHPVVEPSPFDDEATYTSRGAGWAVIEHRLHTNFLNFLPSLMALGWSAGGDTGLLVVPAILGALALLALYAVGTRIVGPRWALLGPVLLTLAPLQSWFSRDAYTELALEVLVLGGLWLFLETRRRAGVVAGAIAGVVIGAMTFVRIDALALFVAIPAALVIEWLRAARLDRPARRRRRGAIVAFGGCAAVTGWTGLAVARHQTPGYFTVLEHNLHLLELALGAGVTAAVVIVVGHLLFRGVGTRLARNDALPAVAVVALLAAAFYAWEFRPKTGPVPPYVPTARRPFDTYFTSASFRWFAWYLGIVTLVLIVIGFIVLGVRALRTDSPAFMLLAVAGPTTLLYIAQPRISPDHLWAMRRFLPIVLPAMTIAAAAAAAWTVALLASRLPMLRAPAVVVLLALMIVPAARAGQPFVRAQMQRGALDAVHDICRTVGPDGAVAIEPDGLLALMLPQAVRGFCNVPAAGVREEPASPVGSDLTAWKAKGRTLFVVTRVENPTVAPGTKATLVEHLTIDDATEPARARGRRPDSFVPRPVEIWIYRVDAA
jgi:hypothetical protein